MYCADIAVLGVGPAGIAAALALSQSGLNVCLIGETVGEGPKVGEFLPASILRLFRTLGLDGLEDVLSVENFLHCNAKKSAWGSEIWTYHDSLRDPEGGGWHILRHSFEKELLALAGKRGIPFHEGRLLEVSDNGAQFRVRAQGKQGPFEIQSPRLIDATGRKAWLVRRVASAPRKRNTQMAVVGWLNDPHHTIERVTQVKSVAHGWWYTAPLPGQQRVVAFHGLPDSVSHYFRRPDLFLKQAQRDSLSDGAALIGPLYSCDASVALSPNIAGKRWLAVGDAALSFDPLSSQGLHFAFYSAIKARDAICKSQQTDDEGEAYKAMQLYCAQISDVFAANQQTRALFYNQERRYRDSPYWSEQRRNF
ncbi:NAD(P)/FAD-dependent oxidoreductase [Tateyamaria pelophila]|uniref:NAD(P)/FAD-dependent oxidoreductase n=1 Tax=Tateyamaria pelophila TaxID=328415 RepID=UPI001CBA9C28|nr:tryptophan 7-halogenase [Tateyamaria pelophila]